MSINAIEESLQAYLASVTSLETALAGLTESHLDLNNEQSWTIRQIVHHIADGDHLWKTAILQAIGKPNHGFRLEWYFSRAQTAWADTWMYHSRPIGDAMALLRASRKYLVELLMMTPQAWDSCVRVRWPKQKDDICISVAEIVAMQTRHLHGHTADILAIRHGHHI
ncbi:MAG: DinB family protein [Chloroflexota bacterium]